MLLLFASFILFLFTLKMGNCMTSNNNKVVSQNKKQEQQNGEEMIKNTKSSIVTSKKEAAKHVEGGKRKKVSFKLSDHEGNIDVDQKGQGEFKGSSGGGVRIRVVVTKEELRQILNHKRDFKCSSLDQLVSAARLRDRSRIHEVGSSDERDINGNWKPALESIPEDH